MFLWNVSINWTDTIRYNSVCYKQMPYKNETRQMTVTYSDPWGYLGLTVS